MSVIEASKDVGVAKRVGYQWVKRWNESGYDGLIPRFADGNQENFPWNRKMNIRPCCKPKIHGT